MFDQEEVTKKIAELKALVEQKNNADRELKALLRIGDLTDDQLNWLHDQFDFVCFTAFALVNEMENRNLFING